MGAIIIRADNKSNRILSELARRLGGTVINLEDEQYEDLAFGAEMDEARTGEVVDRESIIQKLKAK
jgi:hypothetical protein